MVAEESLPPPDPREAQVTAETILGALKEVIDPELGIDVVDLGLVDEVEETGRSVRVWLGMTSPACPAGRSCDTTPGRPCCACPGSRKWKCFPRATFAGLPSGCRTRPASCWRSGAPRLPAMISLGSRARAVIQEENLVGVPELLLYGGLLNAAGIGIFLVNTIRSVQIRSSS